MVDARLIVNESAVGPFPNWLWRRSDHRELIGQYHSVAETYPQGLGLIQHFSQAYIWTGILPVTSSI